MPNSKKKARIRTVRRSDANAGISLRKRRRWYSDESGSDDPNAEDDSSGDDVLEDEFLDLSTLPPAAQKHIYELRSEAKEYRLSRNKARDERDRLAKEKRLLAEKQMEEQGKYKQLAEERAQQITELQAYKEGFDTLEAATRANNDKFIESVPESMRSLIPTDYSPARLAEFLTDNASKLTQRQAPDMDAGAGGTGGTHTPPVKLSADEKNMAAAFDMTDEEYIASKSSLSE